VDFKEDSLVQSLDLMHSTIGGAAHYERLHAAVLR